MRLAVSYEWCRETLDENKDIQDIEHEEELIDAIKCPLGKNQRLVLVRNLGSDDCGLKDRQWAYLSRSGLPEFFDGGAKVLKRHHKELEKILKNRLAL